MAELERRLEQLERQQTAPPEPLPPVTAEPAAYPGFAAQPPLAPPSTRLSEPLWEPIDWQPSISVRGRIHTDIGFFHQSPVNRETVGDIQDGVDFRRLRLGMQGTITEFWRFVSELDFAASTPVLADGMIVAEQLPLLQTVQVGHFVEPFGLEAHTSSNYYTFLERGTNFVFVPFRNWGLATFQNYADERLLVATGVFRTGTDSIGADVGDDGEWATTSRITCLPWYDEPSGGRYYCHLGAAYTFRDADLRSVQFKQLPEGILTAEGEGLIPPFVDTGVIPCVNFQQCAIETAWVHGSLSLQSEWYGTWVNQIDGPALFFHGVYGYVSYFLTGESREYNRRRGTFSITPVNSPFFRVRTRTGIASGPGAWELALRLSYLDLRDPGLPPFPDGTAAGGRLTDLTAGLNWYLNDNIRIQTNYVYAMLDNPNFGNSTANLFLTRFSVYW